MGNNMAFQYELKKKKRTVPLCLLERGCLSELSRVPVECARRSFVQVPSFVCVHLAVGKPCLVVHL